MTDRKSSGSWDSYDRELHTPIKGRLEKALAGRPQKWLAEQTGVPTSTLSAQLGKPNFTLEVLRACATVLDIELGWLVAGEDATSDERSGPAAVAGTARAVAASKKVQQEQDSTAQKAKSSGQGRRRS